MDFQAILAVESDAEALEKLHERDPEGFIQALPEALAASPESALLKEWAQRLVGEAEPHAPQPETNVPGSEESATEAAEPQASQPGEPGDETAVSAESLNTDQADPDQADADQDDTDQGIPTMELPSPEPVAPQALQEESIQAEPAQDDQKSAKPAKTPKPKVPAKPRRVLGPGDATLMDWLALIGLVLLGGVGLSLLDPIGMIFDPNTLFARNNTLVGYALLTILVLHWRGWPRPMSWVALGLFAAAGTYANLVPLPPPGFEAYSPMAGFDNPVNLALLHLPMLMILVLGACYAKGGPLRIAGWKGFIRFYGEASAYGLFLTVGMLLFSAMGGLLFGQLRMDWDLRLLYLALFAVAALQLGGAWLALRHKGSNFAPTFARYLAPWTVLLLAGYLVTTLFAGRLWIGREIMAFMQFLAMVLVMGLSVYGVIDKVERPRSVGDVLLVLLLALALASCWPVTQDLLGLVNHGMDALSLALLGGILALCLLFALQLLALLAKLVGLVSMATVEAVPVFWIPLVGLWWLFMAGVMPWLF